MTHRTQDISISLLHSYGTTHEKGDLCIYAGNKLTAILIEEFEEVGELL
jgi:hypothetical protein